jgi:hypothetical protein
LSRSRITSGKRWTAKARNSKCPQAAVEAELHVWLAKPIAVDSPGVARIEAAARKAAEKKRCFLVDSQNLPRQHRQGRLDRLQPLSERLQ